MYSNLAGRSVRLRGAIHTPLKERKEEIGKFIQTHTKKKKKKKKKKKNQTYSPKYNTTNNVHNY